MSMSNYVPTTDEVREVYRTPLTMIAAWLDWLQKGGCQTWGTGGSRHLSK